MTNKYKCTGHKLDLVFPGCVKAWIARHDAMLEFIKQIVKYWECDPNHAESLLKEIGETQ